MPNKSKKKKNLVQKTTKAIGNFAGEFRTFITRGNVVDMAVGMIVGASFTAIVNALSNSILKPLVNGLLYLVTGGTDGFADALTFLKRVDTEAGLPDLENSIYINWGDFLTAILNFLITAIALFVIVKTINRIKSLTDDVTDVVAVARAKQAKGIRLFRYERRALAEAARKAAEQQEAKEAAEREKEAKAAEEAAAAEKTRAAQIERDDCETRQEQLLREIRDLLQKD